MVLKMQFREQLSTLLKKKKKRKKKEKVLFETKTENGSKPITAVIAQQ